jgi:hypothetical protein
MTDETSGDQAPCPKEGMPPTWIAFSIAVDFYPAIKISRKAGLKFTTELAEHLEPENVHLEGDEWKIDGGGTYEGIELTVTKSQILTHVQQPTSKLEWYEQRASKILRAFETTFEPHVVLQTNVIMNGLVELTPGDTDARAFLGGSVMLMDPNRLDAIGGGHLGILGIRLIFPEMENKDWSADVRIESYGPDPKKVFLQADAAWHDQAEWGTDFADRAVTRVTTVSEFMQGPLVNFLKSPPESDVGDEEDETT